MACEVQVRAVLEADDDLREAEFGNAAEFRQLRQARERLLDRRGDLPFHFLRPERRGHRVDLDLDGRRVRERVHVEVFDRHGPRQGANDRAEDDPAPVPNRVLDEPIQHEGFSLSARPGRLFVAASARAEVASQQLGPQCPGIHRGDDFARQHARDDFRSFLVFRPGADHADVKDLRRFGTEERLVADEHDLAAAFVMHGRVRHDGRVRLFAKDDGPDPKRSGRVRPRPIRDVRPNLDRPRPRVRLSGLPGDRRDDLGPARVRLEFHDPADVYPPGLFAFQFQKHAQGPRVRQFEERLGRVGRFTEHNVVRRDDAIGRGEHGHEVRRGLGRVERLDDRVRQPEESERHFEPLGGHGSHVAGQGHPQICQRLPGSAQNDLGFLRGRVEFAVPRRGHDAARGPERDEGLPPEFRRREGS